MCDTVWGASAGVRRFLEFRVWESMGCWFLLAVQLWMPLPAAADLADTVAPGPAPATPVRWRAPAAVTMDHVGTGELLWRATEGLIPLPVLHTEVEITVSGIILHGRISQRFTNPTEEVIEAVYVFPMPENAAVTHMEMQIGKRRITACISERQKAQQTYALARKEGKKAALVEQERPNLFTTSVANLNPGEAVDVVLVYLDEVTYRNGTFSLAFPLTFTPRYIPDAHVGIDPATGRLQSRSPLVPDAARISPPFVESTERGAPTARVQVVVQAGVPLAEISSRSHAVTVVPAGETWEVSPRDGLLLADRDFLLHWRCEPAAAVQSAWFGQQLQDERYGLLMIVPPAWDDSPAVSLPTRTLFVVDVSGSMDGPSIDQAREALLAALARLRADDEFNLLKFNQWNQLWWPTFQPAEAEPIARARRWVQQLRAEGGTQIYPALLRAIAQFARTETGRVSQVVLITDGAVGNEDQLFREVAHGLGPIRLHVIGIGHAPNRYLMRKLAGFGRGHCDFIVTVGEADNRLDAFLARLDRPVMTDLQLNFAGVAATEIQPQRVSDLFAHEPLLVSVKLAGGGDTGTVTLTGNLRDRPVSFSLPVTLDAAADGVAARWARNKVASLQDSLYVGADSDSVRAAVLELGLKFHLITPYTSLVAVEQVVTAAGDPRRVEVASALPHGSRLLQARCLLPKGGTMAPLRRFAGFWQILVGLAVIFILFRRRT